jgi:hypothetical protein
MKKDLETAFIFRRSFLGFLWGVVIFAPLFVAGYWFKSASSETLDTYGVGIENPYVIGGIAFYMLVGAAYTFVTSHLKHMERVIRLMSEKDNDKMLPAQSLRISKKIFKDSVGFGLIQFLKYYSVIVVVYLLVSGNVLRTLFNYLDDTGDIPEAAVAFVIAGLTLLLGHIYTRYFLAAQIRFVWFVYASRFGEGLSRSALFDEVERLNSVNKGDGLAATAGYLKRDMAVDVASLAASFSVNSEGVGSDVAKGYARGMAIDATEYSKMRLNYRQYKDAYTKLYSKSPELSPKLLSL